MIVKNKEKSMSQDEINDIAELVSLARLNNPTTSNSSDLTVSITEPKSDILDDKLKNETTSNDSCCNYNFQIRPIYNPQVKSNFISSNFVVYLKDKPVTITTLHKSKSDNFKYAQLTSLISAITYSRQLAILYCDSNSTLKIEELLNDLELDKSKINLFEVDLNLYKGKYSQIHQILYDKGIYKNKLY